MAERRLTTCGGVAAGACLAGLLSILGACGGAAFSAASDSGTTSGDDGSGMPAVDASLDGHEAGSALDGGDGSTGADGPIGLDSGMTADTSVDGGCPSFCALHPDALFCSDFDEEPAMQPPTGWTVAASTGASVVVSSAQAESCDNGLKSELPVLGTNGGSAVATRQSPVKGTSPHVVLDLWVRLPAQDTTSFVTYFSVQLGTGTPIGLTHHGDTSFYLDSTPPCCVVDQLLTTPPLVDAWNHMVLDVVYGISGMASLAYEGNDMQPHVVTYTGGLLIPSGAAAVTASLGMVAPGTTQAALDAYYDNVFLTNPP